MKISSVFITVCLAFLSACASQYTMDKLTAEEQTYISKVNASSASFELDKEASEEAWSRGNSFINQFSGMKIQSTNDYHVSTYHPNTLDLGTIGYNLMKELKGKKVRFSITCLRKSLNMRYTEEVCRSNEKIMAYYMMSGELKPKFVNSVVSAAPAKK